MPGEQAGRIRQQAAAGRDANVAGRDQFIVNIGVANPGEPVAPGLLPRDVPGFAGRNGELDRLTRLAGNGSVVVTAISGTAGVGKTALAVHAAHRLLTQFPDGHLYADLRGYTPGQAPTGPGEVLEVFLRRLGVAGEEMPVRVEERAGLLRQVLASRRVLMVLDNAATEAQVRPLLPGAGGSLVIVTSRSVLPGLEADDRIDLDVLSEDEAAALLGGLTGAGRAATDPEAVARVARLCGRLPLALRIAGQLLAAHPAWPVAKLARMLAGERDRLARLAVGDLQVRAAFEVSYAQLAEGDARLFRLLGLHPGPDFTAAAAASLAGTGPEEAGPVLDRLAEAHLVTEDASSRFRMHDLLRLFARGACQEADGPADREAAEARLAGHYADLARYLDSCVDPRLRPAAAQAGVPLPSMREALTIFEAGRPSLLATLGLAAQRGWDEQVQLLAESTGDSLTVLRYLDDLLTVREAALAAARRAWDTPAEGRALGNLGNAYTELRRFEEAIGCYQQALAIFRETGDRRGEGQTLYNLGTAYAALRRFEEAIGCHQQALAIFRETGDRHGEGVTLNNLGEAYRELRHFEEAIGCYQQALAIRRETGDRHGEGLTVNNLGEAYWELGRFEEAIGCYQQSLAVFRETGDRHGEGVTLNNLGEAYRELRHFEEAIGCHQQALAIRRETGDRHGEGQTLNNLGTAYAALRHFEEAIGCHQQALAISRETGDRYDEGQTLNNLGLVYREMRQPDRAAMCWRQAAAAMHDAGDYEEAGRLEQRAADARCRRRRWRRLTGTTEV